MTAVLELASSDGQRKLTINAQSGGFCRFTEWTLTEGDHRYEGLYWIVTYWSGLYATPAEAEADARNTLPWLRTELSD